MEVIGSDFNVDTGTGTDSLTLDDSGDVTGDVVTIDATIISGRGGRFRRSTESVRFRIHHA